MLKRPLQFILLYAAAVISIASTSFADSQIPYEKGAWQWQAVNPMTQSMFLPVEEVMPLDSSVTKRLQFWLDKLHQKLQETEPATFQIIPKPVVRIVYSRGIEGYVRPSIACHSKAVDVDSNPLNKKEYADVSVLAALVDKKLSFGLMPGKTQICESLNFDTSAVQKVLQLVTDESASCSVKSENPLIFSTDCWKYEKPAPTSNRFGYLVTANLISISAGLINLTINEDQLVGVLLHEAAHYYGAHATIGRSKSFKYFYDQNEKHGLKRPTPRVDLQEIGQNALRAGDAFDLRKIEGQIYHSAAAQSLNALPFYFGPRHVRHRAQSCTNLDCELRNQYEKNLRALCDGKKDCLLSCGQFVADYENFNFLDEVRNAPFTFSIESFLRLVKPRDQSRYLNGEQAFRRCASTITFKTNSESGGLTLSDAVGLLEPSINQSHPKIHSAYTLANYFEWISESYKNADVAIKKATEAHIGYYTAEQEADVMSVRFSYLIGVNPRQFPRLFLNIIGFEESAARFYGRPISINHISKSDCEDYRLAKWHKYGKPVILPIGNFLDDHHSNCFRVQVLDQTNELAAKLYGSYPATNPELMNSGQWAEFKAKNLGRIR